jgi:hypothetical protein
MLGKSSEVIDDALLSDWPAVIADVAVGADEVSGGGGGFVSGGELAGSVDDYRDTNESWKFGARCSNSSDVAGGAGLDSQGFGEVLELGGEFRGDGLAEVYEQGVDGAAGDCETNRTRTDYEYIWRGS